LKNEQWAINLSALLKGKALEVYSRLPTESALDYKILKSALFKRFELTEEGFKKRLRLSRPETCETFVQFASRQENSFHRWRELAGIPATYEVVVDMILRDQLRVLLKERIPKDRNEMALLLADQFSEARGGASIHASRRSETCSPSPSRHRSSMPEVKGQRQSSQQFPTSSRTKRCYSCGGFGHFSYECQAKKGNPQKPTAVAIDLPSQKHVHFNGNDTDDNLESRRSRSPYRGRYNRGRGRGRGKPTCGLTGSIPTPCVDDSVERQESVKLSSTCHQGTFSMQMPTSKGKVGNHVVTVLRDTGCVGVVVALSQLL
jgi:hypothetical protein